MTPNDASLTAPYPLCLEGICDVFVEYVIPLSAFDKTMIQQMCASKWYHQISSHTDYDKQIEAVQAHYVSPSVEVQQVISELLWEHRTSFKALNRNVATLTSADLAHWQREDDPKFEQGHSQPDNEQLFESPQTQTHLPLAYPALRSPSADPLQQYPQHFELHETDASTSQPHSQQQPQHSQQQFQPAAFGAGMLAQDEEEEPDFEVVEFVEGKRPVKRKRIVKSETEEEPAPMVRTRSANRSR